MSNKLVIPVKEDAKHLRTLLKQVTPLLQPRIKMLLLMLKSGEQGVSKRELMDSTGVSSQSIQTWRTNYSKGGLALLLRHGRIGFKPSIFTKAEHLKLEAVLNNPENNLQGYKELQQWCIKEFRNQFLYNSVMKYAIKNFGTKIKVARKYHAKKNEEAVSAFKKTSVKSASRPAKSK